MKEVLDNLYPNTINLQQSRDKKGKSTIVLFCSDQQFMDQQIVM